MNCQSFESIVADFARERELDAATRGAAAAHAGECQACARRLASARALMAGLRAVAAGDVAVGAPRRVEAALLAAFREQHAAPAAPNVVPIERGRRRVARPRWAAAAAAAVAVLSGAVAWQVSSQQTGTELATSVPKNPVVQPSSRVAPDVPQVTPGPTPKVGAEVRQVSTGATPRPPKARTTTPARATQRPAAPDVAPQSFEIATEFYPLVAGGGMAPTDGGQIVRLEVPRSSLAAMGFMMNPEHAEERVTADVLVGHDGLAQAIRFVQPAMTTERRAK